jgi:DinB family protein
MNETAQQYIRRITAYVEGRLPLTVLAATANGLERLIKGVPASALRERPAADKWSASEIVAHLGDAEIVTGFRIRLILGAPGTAIAAYDQDSWVTSGHYETRDPDKSVEQFRVLREANLALLTSLTPEQWQQYGMHSERGQETIEQIVRMTAGHDINHLQQIERLLPAKAGATGAAQPR